MASKNTETCGTQIKKGQVQETQFKLAQKLQLDLERDILRLFQDSIYCDIKFIVLSSSLLTHSCILKARASRFYKFILAEFEVLEENGISVFNICNASFTDLQTFVENIYKNLHSFHAEDKIINHLRQTKYQSIGNTTLDKPSLSSAITPEADLFFTPKCSPSELQKPFTSSKLKISDNDVASYYKITVDDIPIDEKLEGKKLKFTEEKLLEKELAEQDELYSSFQTILSKKNKGKPNSFSIGTSSQSAKKSKPKLNRKIDLNLLVLDNQDKNKDILPLWKPNPISDRSFQRAKFSNVKTIKRNLSNFKSQEKIDLGTYLEDPTNSASSDMDVSTTAGDSGLEVSLICQQETSPRENTMSETSGVDLTEAAINEDIPNDETLSTKQSSVSSVSSEPGTWDANDDFKMKSPLNASAGESLMISSHQAGLLDDTLNGKNQLNEDEILRLDEMEKNMRDCEMFLYMERQASNFERSYRNSQFHSMTNDDVPGSVDDIEILQSQNSYQYAKENQMTNAEEFLQGETDHGQNYDELKNNINRSYGNENNLDDAIYPEDKNCESFNANESVKQGVSGDIVHCNSEYFSQPDILKDVQEVKTPPCTPKKFEKEESDGSENVQASQDTNSRNWENNHATGVSNYFIDASSLLDEDEIISPPISLINFKSLQSFEGDESNNNTNVVEEPKTVSKKVVTNFYTPEENNETYFLKENERRQGDIVFKNSIPLYSKHIVEENQIVDSAERLRGGADNFNIVDDESEQVVPSADVEFSPPCSLVNKQEPEECCYSVQSDYFEPAQHSFECESESGKEYAESTKEHVSESPTNVAESVRDDLWCKKSPNLRRRNEAAPILSGGMDFVEEEKKVQKKPSHFQGEAWIVTFDDDKKTRNKLTLSESKKENGEDKKMQSVHIDQSREGKRFKRKEPSTEFYFGEKSDEINPNIVKAELKAYPIEKSNSSGYFLDFSKDCGSESVRQDAEVKTEKKNIFSMFIEMDDNSKSTFSRKPKPALEREGTFDKSFEDTSKEIPKTNTIENKKKPFYMFIQSDSPNVKRRQMFRKTNKSSTDTESSETSSVKNFLKVQSPEVQAKPEAKSDFEYSSSDNSIPYLEENFKVSRPLREKLPLPLPLNKFRGNDSNREPKITAWAETKQPSDSTLSSESWLKTRDIQINYRGRGNQQREDVYLQDSAFTLNNKYKDKYFGKSKCKESKPPERDSGVILSDKGDDSFVKLSDLDSSDTLQTKRSTDDKTSRNISEDDKVFSNDEITLSKSVGSEEVKADSKAAVFYDKNINQSLSRLFPNLNAQSLARMGKKDGDRSEIDVQASEISEVSSSMQSSVEPSGLEVSTSETDVSTHVGTTSKLGEDLLKMFLEEISPDVVVEVNGRRIKAHKCILSSRCQYFAAMLSGGWVESAGNVISLQGFDPECYETNEERDILSDTKTKFVPPKYSCASSKTRRKTRTIYKPIAFQKVYAQLLDRRKKRRLRRIQMTYLRDFLERNIRRANLQVDENENAPPYKTKTGKSRKRKVCKKQKKYKKRKDPWYLKESPIPDNKIYRQIDDDVDHEKLPLGEAEEGEQINIGPNYESWLLMRSPNSGEREVFHAFWKGEGNLKSIRKAQTKMMLSFMDPSVDPCQDFYQFACGNWGLKNPIPKDKAGYDTFEMLRESLDIVLQDLLMEEDNDTTNEATLKTKNLYRSCMNNKILEERREKPLLVLLESLGGWPMIDPNWKAENFDWIVLMAKLRLYNNDILISEWVGPDIKNSDEYIIQFDQTSLGLPTREYFLEPCNYVYLEAYKNYLIKISTLLGSSLENAKAEAEDLMIFETALAEITSSPDERRNVSELYERMTVSELSETVPEINWVKYLTIVLNREVDPQEPVVMFALRYVQDLVKLLCQTEPRVVSNYLLWRFIRHRVNNLDDRFQEAKQHFYYILFGREEAPPRWKNCVAQVNTNMGMGLGAMFVARYFDEKSKNDTLEMTHDIMRSFREILNHTVWIDNETKRLAIQKVDAMMLRIGYPDFILNKEALNERYAEVHIDPELYFENTLNILKHLTRAEQDRLGTRVNKSMWNTPPAVVNAYYSRNKNQIMFPAGILQPPFYHRYFPRSLNYGGIGVVIGHEITHGFDDKGRLFDQDGNLHKWWKEPAIEAFHERAQCLIDQYSKYTVTEVGMQIDGVNTQGENIADNGGIKQAFKAYERWLSIHGDKDEVLQGINATNLQLFFLNFAQIWCGTMRPEATRNKLKTAVHSPGKFRVIGTLSNSEDFARVFQCEPGSPMNPIKKCSVWFSYNAVHFALRHIYSGESRIPESLSIVELATLADMLCLDGLQEIISYNLKVKYCHSFHVPCSVCSVGVIDCLPVAAAYGLDDLYRKCLRWITKYFVKIWPTKSFGSLPKELLEKCYQHYVVHMTVDHVLDTIVNIDKVRGSLPNVRWAESVSRLVNKLHGTTVRYIAEHFSSVLTSDNFLALGKEAGWNVSRLEDSLIETIRYLPPEQACWSHARLHRILTVATGPDPPPEMDWNENFLKLLQLMAELVENSLIKQAPRAAKSKAWRQMEPELRSRIQEAACLVLPDQEQSSDHRRSNHVKKETGPPGASQTAKNRNFEIRQIKLAMSQQTSNRNSNTNRPLSLQMDQRPKKDTRLIPLRTSMSTSSVRKSEPSMDGIRKTQSRSHILGNATSSEPKKTINPRYSKVKSRYLEPKSPLNSTSDKSAVDSNQRRNFRYISSSDSSRNCSPALRPSSSRSSIPQTKKPNPESSRQHRNTVLKSGSTSTLGSKKSKTVDPNKPDLQSVQKLSRFTKEENMSTDSLCTDSLVSEKEVTVRLRPGKENLGERKSGNSVAKSSSNSPVSRRHSSESWSSTAPKTSAARKTIKPPNENKSNPPKRITAGKTPVQKVTASNLCKSNVLSQKTATAQRNQKNAGKFDKNLVNGNPNHKISDFDSENNKKNLKDTATQPSAVERSGTFLKEEPTILKKPQVGTEV